VRVDREVGLDLLVRRGVGLTSRNRSIEYLQCDALETVCASMVDQVKVEYQVPALTPRKVPRAVFRLLIRTQ
jgi:hypothetical protein